jgi:hypothetical protein
LMKKQNHRNSLPQYTQSCQSRPRTRIHKMISMMRSGSCLSLHRFFLSVSNRCVLFLQKELKSCHFFFSVFKKERERKDCINFLKKKR